MDVFISCSSEDCSVAKEFESALGRVGVTSWRYPEIKPGGVWTKEVMLNIESAILFVVLVSPRSLKSVFVYNELVDACDRGKKIVPIYLDDCRFSSEWKLKLGELQGIVVRTRPRCVRLRDLDCAANKIAELLRGLEPSGKIRRDRGPRARLFRLASPVSIVAVAVAFVATIAIGMSSVDLSKAIYSPTVEVFHEGDYLKACFVSSGPPPCVNEDTPSIVASAREVGEPGSKCSRIRYEPPWMHSVLVEVLCGSEVMVRRRLRVPPSSK